MRIKKEFKFGMIFLIGVLLVASFVSAVYIRSGAQYIEPGSAGFFGGTGTEQQQCEEGQDFIIQITSCEPIVVRSDLLEEQNVPVFCKLSATKINPLIDVNAIDYISFEGSYPAGVSGVGFHPAKAALGGDKSLDSAVLENIGYAVIVLKQQKSEAEMPGYVQGELTAKIRYDIENAFGIGDAKFYLSELEDGEWENKKNQYSFWDGRFFLKVNGIDATGGMVSVYDGSRKITSTNLEKGETSGMIYVPGFDCKAGLKLKLNDLSAPDTRAKLRINSDVMEIADDETFLDSNCQVTGIDKVGAVQRVDISCKGDEKRESFSLRISPKVELEINGVNGTYEVGNYLYQADDGKFVYLGYLQTRLDTGKKEDLEISLFAKPVHEDFSDDELSAAARITEAYDFDQKVKGKGVMDALETTIKFYSGVGENFLRWMIGGNSFTRFTFKEGKEKLYGADVQILGFAGPKDEELEGDALESYTKAKEDYETIINSFSGEASEFINKDETLGERALFNLIELSFELKQDVSLLDFCEEFERNHPNSKLSVKNFCEEGINLANAEIASKDIEINGKTKRISFEGIYEPSFNELGASLTIRGPSGNTGLVDLKKNQAFFLNEFTNEKDKMFSFRQSKLSRVYFRFVQENWQWSLDQNIWTDVPETTIQEGNAKGMQPLQISQNVIKALEGKGFETGKALILSQEDSREDFEFIRLESVDEDSVEVFTNLNTGIQLSSSTKKLRKGLPENVGAGYTFTLTNTNVKKQAEVSVLADINSAGTEATFPFKIGIEKRGIKLSPEKTKDIINNLENSINRLEKINDNLGNVVKVMKASCLGVGTILTVKNFLANTGGKGIARQKVMRGAGGWYENCTTSVSQGKYYSIDDCFNQNSNKIDSAVNEVYEKMQQQNELIKRLQENFVDRDFLGEGVVNTDSFKKAYYDEIKINLKNNLRNKFGLTVPIDGKDLEIDKFVDVYLSSEIVSVEELRDFDLYSQLGGEAGAVAKGELEKGISNIYEMNKEVVARNTLSDDFGVPVFWIHDKEKVRNIKIKQDVVWSEIKGNFDEYTQSMFDNDALVQIGGEKLQEGAMMVELDPDHRVIGTYPIEISSNNPSLFGIYGSSWGEPNPFDLAFEKIDASTYGNKFISVSGEDPNAGPVVKYYETDPYKGNPALVPFDVEHGWYAHISQTLPILGNIRAYDSSGRVSSFDICNVGKNGIAEFTFGFGDDDCMTINTGTGQPRNQLLGLDSNKATELITLATKAVYDAQKQHGKDRVLINGKYLNVGSPAIDVPDMECQDFMSPTDCKLLFNVCDPVICPSSRCNFGGAYPVQDVVQSGIFGSIALCLPNAKEGIYIPVCLSGVHAGIDGFVSVEKAYRDCLQHSLETGEQIGVCDQIHSIYLCEMVWKNALPLANWGIPKIFSVFLGQNTRGGGEYLGVKDAWSRAGNSFDFFINYYAENSYKSFKARSVEDVGTPICKNFVSVVFPTSGGALDAMIEPDSPVQLYGRFEETPFTTSTNPPISQYKVYYHVYSGKDKGTYYKVYLKPGAEGSFYRDLENQRMVAQGYIQTGDYASETLDFTAPSGYKELCIMVNEQEHCGFQQVTTEFGLNYIKDKYMEEQTNKTNVKSTAECISGSASWYGLLGGADDAINPSIYEWDVVRVCSTKNPSGTERWAEVGHCDDPEMKCWLDMESVKRVIDNENIKEGVLEGQLENSRTILENREGYLNEEQFANNVSFIKEKENSAEKISLINAIINKVFLNKERGYLHLLRGNAFAEIAKKFVPTAQTPGGEICPTPLSLGGTSQDKVLEAAKELEGTQVNELNCFEGVYAIYTLAGVGKNCVYTDERRHGKYFVKDSSGNIIEKEHQIPVTSSCNRCGSCLIQSEGNYASGNPKFNLSPGDLLSIFNNWQDSGKGHNVIFIEWVDKDKGIARVSHLSGLNDPKTIRYSNYDLSINPVVQIWEPV